MGTHARMWAQAEVNALRARMGRPAIVNQQAGLSAADLERLGLDIRRLREECGVPRSPLQSAKLSRSNAWGSWAAHRSC